MRPWHWLLVALLFIPQPASADPPREPEDDRLFELFNEGGREALSAAQMERFKFWAWHQMYKAQMHKMRSGGIFTDDFNDNQLDLFQKKDSIDAPPALLHGGGKWRIWNSDPGIKIDLVDGMLRIHGKSTVPGGLNFNGLVGRIHDDTDIVLVADMKAVAPEENLPGTHLSMVHLCGSSPDFFNELCFGRSKDDLVGWTHHQARGFVPEMRNTEGIPPLADEHEEFYTIKLDHEASTELSRAWLLIDGQLREIGQPRTLVMSSSKVELKVNVPTLDAEVECYFDNCRMYRRPETHPARFLVFTSPVGKSDIEGVKIELFLGDDEEPSLTALTNQLGWASLPLPADQLYPVAAKARVTLVTGETYDHVIAREDVEGLYPGDVWVMRLNQFDMAGDDRWWQRVREITLEKAREAAEQ